MKKFFIILFALFLLLPIILSAQIALAVNCATDLKGHCAPIETETGISCKTGEADKGATDDCKTSSGDTCCAPSTPASTTPSTGGTSVSDLGQLSPVGGAQLPVVIGNVINVVLGVTGSFALVMVVYGGIILLSSAGHQESVKKGKDILTWAIIGVMVTLASYFLVNFIFTAVT